jgi:hypothetical protein
MYPLCKISLVQSGQVSLLIQETAVPPSGVETKHRKGDFFMAFNPAEYGVVVPPHELSTLFNKITEKSKGSVAGVVSLFTDTTLLVSTKDHKLEEISHAMNDMGIKRAITRVGISPIVEPNWIKKTDTMMRGKSQESIEAFFKDYPFLGGMLEFCKQLEIDLLFQDVRPKSGEAGTILSPLTNPGPDVTLNDIPQYLQHNFRHGTGLTTVRLENALDRVRVVYDSKEKRKMSAKYSYRPVVGAAFVTYGSNPLHSKQDLERYLTLCRSESHNDRSQKHLLVAGGLLNEFLPLHALLSGIEVYASLQEGIAERTDDLSLKYLFEQIYSPAMIAELDKVIPIKETGGKQEERLRNLARVSIQLKDFAKGGSREVVATMFRQKSGKEKSEKHVHAIDLKPDFDVVL